MVILVSVLNVDFGPMKKHEENAKKGDLFTTGKSVFENEHEMPVSDKGKVIDLILPVIILIAFCVTGMIYTGGFFSGTNFIDAFANSDASYGLSIGSIGALIVIIFYFLCRRVLSFRDCMEAIPEGFKQMVPAILILTFAWTLKSMTGLLDASAYVSTLVSSATAVQVLLPAILFVVAVGLSFATGTSWGTFGILIPIITGVFEQDLTGVASNGAIPSMVIICISACLAGAVCGDHCSPISDTTIMASTGAQCDHVNHVSTQLPYVMTVAGISLVCYIIAGFVQNVFVLLGIGVAILTALMLILYFINKRKKAKVSES